MNIVTKFSTNFIKIQFEINKKYFILFFYNYSQYLIISLNLYFLSIARKSVIKFNYKFYFIQIDLAYLLFLMYNDVIIVNNKLLLKNDNDISDVLSTFLTEFEI
jgi:hypothetical protein